jgi:AAA family ATP:ADP antiporter
VPADHGGGEGPSTTERSVASAGGGNWLQRAVDARPGEGAALVWSCAYHFFVLCAYYVLRPIRDEMGAAGGVDNLAWLFTGTLVAMLVAQPLFGGLVARLPRRRFVPLTYRFFIVNLVAFFLLLRTADATANVWIGRVFFIWTSVFNLFVVSVFWSFMTDIFRPGQGKRLFGVVAVGGTVGSVLGSTITTTLAAPLGSVNLLLVSALILELAAQAARALDRREAMLREADAGADPGRAPAADAGGNSETLVGGGVLDGVRHVLQSPYLLAIAVLMLFYTITSTFLYFQQVEIVATVFGEDREARTRVFAAVDLGVNVLTLLTQLFLTGRVVRWVGVGATLAFLPLVTIVGFAVLGATPVLWALVAFQVLRRAGNFAIQRPAREALYTVLPRSEKYKAKNFNDTFVYRLGDQMGAWSYTWMGVFGLGLSGLAFSMVPVSIAWLALALWLGRAYRTREAVSPDATR